VVGRNLATVKRVEYEEKMWQLDQLVMERDGLDDQIAELEQELEEAEVEDG
jgi:hypothetical protein